VPRITDFCCCIYVFGCKLSLVRLCDSDFGITPVGDIIIIIIIVFLCVSARFLFSVLSHPCLCSYLSSLFFLQLLLSLSVLFSFQITVCYLVTFIIFCHSLSGVLFTRLICLLRFSHTLLFVCLFLVRQPPVGLWTRPLPYNTQHSQQTDIHAPGGIQTHNLSRRAAADLHLRPRGNWDLLTCFYLFAVHLPLFIFLVLPS